MENDYTEEEEYTEDKVVDMLSEALYESNAFEEARIYTFEEAGVLTNDKGILLNIGEQKIYITVQVQ